MTLTRKTPLRRSAPKKRSQGISPASKEQREKVKAIGFCRNCGGTSRHWPVHPAHAVPRGMGGCDSPDCVVELCLPCHCLQEQGKIDILPLLTLQEQAHAVSHLGILGALRQLTGRRWEAV
jgi:hypothetical protein